LIKRHLKEKKHPLRELIETFKSSFYEYWLPSLTKASPSSDRSIKEALKTKERAVDEVHYFIKMLFFATVKFYTIEIKERDLKKDLLINLLTNIVLTEDVYFILFQLISKSLEPQLQNLKAAMAKSPGCLSFDRLKVPKAFQFDEEFRNLFEDEESASFYDNSRALGVGDSTLSFTVLQRSTEKSQYGGSNAYADTIRRLLQVIKIEQPMSKLEHIYNCCTKSIEQELDAFWHQKKIPSSDLYIDADKLQGIMIYIISRTNYPQILTEITITEEFLTKAVQLSNRAFYVVMIRASIEYLLEHNFEKDITITGEHPPEWASDAIVGSYQNKSYQLRMIEEDEEEEKQQEEESKSKGVPDTTSSASIDGALEEKSPGKLTNEEKRLTLAN